MQEATVRTVTAMRPPQRHPSRTGDDADRLLARVAAAGDREAFAELYELFAPRLKSFLMRVGTAADQAEDLAQEAMVRVWRKATLYDPAKASAATWIYAIARNLRIDALRRQARPDLDPNEPMILPESEPMADDVVARRDRDKRIGEVFAALPPNQQEVVALHFYEDEPHSAIARRLNLPLGTVKSRLRLAFARIKRELEGLE